MTKKYLFVDGGFFRNFILEMQEQCRTEHGLLEVDFDHVGSTYDRILFYDAYPEKRDNQSEKEHDEEMNEVELYFDKISKARNFSVRPALTRRGTKREQKGVDVLLAIECLQHAIRNNIDEVTIMTSDLDFYPLFEALLQTRTRSTLRYHPNKTSNELINAADNSHPLTLLDFCGWLINEHADLKGERNYNSDNIRKKVDFDSSGNIDGKVIEFFSDGENYFAVFRSENQVYSRNSKTFLAARIEQICRSKIDWH